MLGCRGYVACLVSASSGKPWPPKLARAFRSIAWFAACALVVLALGGIPGSSTRAVLYDLIAPPVPSEIGDRAGAVDVELREPSGKPIAQANARALAIVGGRAYLADMRETDAAGRARLVGLPPGEVWIVADAVGRERRSVHRMVGPVALHELLVLGPEHTVRVVVRDELGAGIKGAEVQVASDADLLPVGARTGASGAVIVGRLGGGPWVVTARSEGLEEGSGHGSIDGETVAVVLRKLGGLTVHVVGPDDTPAKGARVQVAGAALWPARVAEADGAGDVHIGGLAAGAYALRATRENLVSPIELGVLLGRGEEKSASLRLGSGSWVAVRVTEGDADDGPPLAGARLTLAEAGLSPFPFEATSDAKGRARLGPLAAGVATLMARADGFVARGAIALTSPVAGETRVALLRAGALTGRVVDARGFPVDGATVEIVGTDLAGLPIVDDPRRAGFQAAQFDALLPGPSPLVPAGELGVTPGPVPAIPQGTTLSSVLAPPGAVLPYPPASLSEPWVTRDDGTFRASPATPGRVRALVRHPQYVEAESEVVALAPGAEAHVEVVLREGGALEGRVFDSGGQPAAGVRLTASALRGSLERSTRTASDGSFAFAALPDAVVLHVGDDAEDLVRLEVAVPEQGRKEVEIHLPASRDPLAVAVVDDRDFPVDDAQVHVSSLVPDTPLRETVFTDRQGEATVGHAAGLPVRVEVSAPGRAPKVVSSAGLVELRVVLARAETATGNVVTARRREPVAEAEVTLYTDLGVRRVRTGPRGDFTIDGLAPGPATLRVRAPTLAPFADALTVPDSSGSIPLAIPRIELMDEAIVEGDVFDARGNPVSAARVARDHVPTWLVGGVRPTAADGFVLTDQHGHFVLGQLPEGSLTLEAYAPGAGRGHLDGVKVVSGRTTVGARIDLAATEVAAGEPPSTGSIAVTLGETAAPVEVQVVSVVPGSEAERGGLAPGDTVEAIDGKAVASMEDARARMSGPMADDVVMAVRRGGEVRSLRIARESVRR